MGTAVNRRNCGTKERCLPCRPAPPDCTPISMTTTSGALQAHIRLNRDSDIQGAVYLAATSLLDLVQFWVLHTIKEQDATLKSEKVWDCHAINQQQ